MLWGAYHGLFLSLDRLFMKRLLTSLPRPVAIGFTFLAVTVGWVLFRAPDFASARAYLTAMADPGRASQRFVIVTADLHVVMLVGLMICFLPALAPLERLRHDIVGRPQWETWRMLAACALLLLAIGKATTVAFHPFLYFRF